MKRAHNDTLKLVISALCLALSYVLPFLTGQIPEIGSMLLPMHIPVLLCGFICGWRWGLYVGFIAPIIRSLTQPAPIPYPNAVCMAVELAVYGAIAGLLYKHLPKKKINVYTSLLGAMVLGRIAYGIAMTICMGLAGKSYAFSAFIASAVTGAIPGIIIQIILVPVLVMAIKSKRGLKLND